MILLREVRVQLVARMGAGFRTVYHVSYPSASWAMPQ